MVGCKQLESTWKGRYLADREYVGHGFLSNTLHKPDFLKIDAAYLSEHPFERRVQLIHHLPGGDSPRE